MSLLLLWIVLGAAAALLLIWLLLFCFGFHRWKSQDPFRKAVAQALQPYQPQIDAGIAWYRSQGAQSVHVLSHDGLRLAGEFLPAPGGVSRKTVLLVHGYRACPYRDFCVAFRPLHELGFNILLLHQRAHWESEGKYIAFGALERYDVQVWCDYINRRVREEAGLVDSVIFLYGMSMGAATVMLAAGLPLPDNVRGVIADSGFTSPWDICSAVLRQHRLPVQPLLSLIDWLTRRRIGFSLRECSSETALRVSQLPLLLIHGEADPLVPCAMARANAAAAGDRATLVTVPGAGHGLSYFTDPERVDAALLAFLRRYEG